MSAMRRAPRSGDDSGSAESDQSPVQPGVLPRRAQHWEHKKEHERGHRDKSPFSDMSFQLLALCVEALAELQAVPALLDAVALGGFP